LIQWFTSAKELLFSQISYFSEALDERLKKYERGVVVILSCQNKMVGMKKKRRLFVAKNNGKGCLIE
jgi:exonuclease VII small subunit